MHTVHGYPCAVAVGGAPGIVGVPHETLVYGPATGERPLVAVPGPEMT
jgi:hypothetical protein